MTPFLAFPPEVRRVIYTTDESVKGRASESRAVFGRWIGRGVYIAGPEIASCGVGFMAGGLDDFWFWARESIVASERFAAGCRWALRLRVGVVDPRAKRRFWD